MKLISVSAGYKKKTVVRQVSFSLGKGACGLLGPNGAGKTTLLRAISGVIPYEGEIKTDGLVGYLPQRFGIYNELTVAEAMEYFALLSRVPKKEMTEEIKRCLELTNMEQYSDKRVGKLSGGMLRRLGIAQSVLGRPQVILLDEPTTGLDPEERMRFKLMINGIKKDCTVLLSTHIVEDVTDVCDNVMIMYEGKILEEQGKAVIPVAGALPNMESYYLSRIKHEHI